MKQYEQLYFDLLKEYQTPNSTTPLKPLTLAVTEILKKSNITDPNLLKAVTDILEKEPQATSSTPENTQTSSQSIDKNLPEDKNKVTPTGVKM